MRKPANHEFDAKVFIAKVGAGKTILEFRKNQHVFKQGEVADTVFYIQKGRVKLTVLSEQGKEAIVAQRNEALKRSLFRRAKDDQGLISLGRLRTQRPC